LHGLAGLVYSDERCTLSNPDPGCTTMKNVHPLLEEFVTEYVQLTLQRGNKTMLNRNMIFRDFLDIYGPLGMSLPHIKKQITFVMNQRYPRRNPSHSWGQSGATWVIGGTLS